jgi:hypothetical protein
MAPGRRGLPRRYCSDRCGWRARNKRRARKAKPALRLVVREARPPSASVEDDPRFASLEPEARAWVADVLERYEVGASRELLLQAATILSRSLQARGILDHMGLGLPGVSGTKVHPLVKVEHDAATLFARLCKQLGIEE